VNCTDVAIVKAAYGKRAGQAGYDARADVNGDKIVNVTDLATVTRALPAGTRC
jgi:trimeric autotransporter adhesin